MSDEKQDLRVITYMCPTHPVELYELILELLETAIDCHTVLQYESRSPGPLSGRPDPFIHNKIDLVLYCGAVAVCRIAGVHFPNKGGAKASKHTVPAWQCDTEKRISLTRILFAFMTAAAYMKLRDTNNDSIELLPVTPVFAHQMNVENRPGYFSDIIIHCDKKAHNVNTLLDLRGCTFAYSDEGSLSGSKIVLKTLKAKGENASFFGSLLKSGSHLASAQMVLSKQAEWAAVDSTTLLYSKKFMQDGGKEIITLETLGRLPSYPIVVNSRLPDVTKHAISKALLNLPHSSQWKNQFAKFGLLKFDTNSDGVYDGPAAQVWAIQNEKLNVRYY